MKICGLQKLTLLDYPGKVACTVFLGGCNFRCPYCYNAPLVFCEPGAVETIEPEALYAFLERRAGVLDGVCITGGEPLCSDITELVRGIRARGYAVKLDTNGAFPQRLRALCEQGLVDYVAMDLKNTLSRYPETIGVPAFDPAPIAESVRFLLTGSTPYEFRTTLAKQLHTEKDLCEMGQLIAGAAQYFLQSYADTGAHIGAPMQAFSKARLEELLAVVRQSVPNAALRGV